MSVAPSFRLWPDPTHNHQCPFCGCRLEASGICIPGMRTLAELQCPACGKEFFGDLPSGHGLPYPALLDKATGKVHHRGTMIIFADYLARSFGEPSDADPGFQVESFRPLQRPILLNCLDWLYGHGLLKLLNAQYHIDNQPELDLVILVPRYLRWLVPDGAAEVWTVDIPLSRGWEWNPRLAQSIQERMADLDWWLSPAFPHPRREDFDLERFTRTRPFPLLEWQQTTSAPTITYVWRGDRDWGSLAASGKTPTVLHRVNRRLGRDLNQQTARITSFAEELLERIPNLDFGVIGLDAAGRFPDWIRDFRDPRPDAERERAWCERLARSHVAIGVHGSNMLLPSGLAGGVVEWVPNSSLDSRWGNVIQDLLVRGDDARDVLFRYRFLPMETSAEEAASMVASIVYGRAASWALLDGKTNRHASISELWKDLPERMVEAEPGPKIHDAG